MFWRNKEMKDVLKTLFSRLETMNFSPESQQGYFDQMRSLIQQRSQAMITGHNGSLGATRDWRTYANVKDNAAFIKTRTANKTMPPSGPLTQKQIDQITCWVDDGALNN